MGVGMMRLMMTMVMLVKVNIKVILKFKIKIILITQALCFCKYLVDEEEKNWPITKRRKKYLVQASVPPLVHLHRLQPSTPAKEICNLNIFVKYIFIKYFYQP